jgi:glycosyltransferase involved in cell wall biosynthesis
LEDRFAAGLYGLAELARERGGLTGALRSELAVRVLQSACRAPGALRAAHSARVDDLLAVAERLERALRPLSLAWYGDEGWSDDRGRGDGHARGESDSAERDPGLAAADLCHAVGGGPAALPGLLAKRFFGTPLLITEYGVRLREHYLASSADAVAPAAAGAPVRALLASFQRQLAREAYTQAQLITPGNTHARRWQERCGAPAEKLRTVYPGMDDAPFTEIGEQAGSRKPSGDEQRGPDGGDYPDGADASTVVWAGCIEPAKDLIGLLHAFAELRRSVPGARLRIIATAPGREPEASEYEARCRALAAQLFPDEAADAVAVGESPVSFEELGSPAVPTLADAYGAGCVVVLSSLVEGFPLSLVEAMFSGRATVSTDVGAVCEVIGGTGLVVPSRNPRALADSCAALLRDPARRERLGAAARARALELFTVEQNVAAFRGIYLELMSRWPVRGSEAAVTHEGGDPLPFGRPAESQLPGRWAGIPNGSAAAAATVTGGRRPGGIRESVRLPASPTRSQDGPLSSRASVPSWARPDLPDSTPIGPRTTVRTETRLGDSR